MPARPAAAWRPAHARRDVVALAGRCCAWHRQAVRLAARAVWQGLSCRGANDPLCFGVILHSPVCLLLLMSLLEETPAPAPSAPRLGNYLLPGLVLLNIWLALALAGALPVFFGDRPDPSRFESQVDAERVRILPAAMLPLTPGAAAAAPEQGREQQGAAARPADAAGKASSPERP